MKKIISFALMIAMLLTSIGAFAENTVWHVEEYVDEFNDPTGEKYVVAGPLEGTFSNSATSNSELEAYVFSDALDVWIGLYEYGDRRVNNPFSNAEEYKIAVKVSLDNWPNEEKFYFMGYIPSGSSKMYIYNCMYDQTYQNKIGGRRLNNVSYKTLMDVLKRATQIKFSIQGTGSSLDKYIFGINPSTGFETAIQSTTGLTVGMRVQHEELGEGTIISFEYRTDLSAFGIPEGWYAEIKYDNGEESGLLQYPDIFNTKNIKIID